MVFKKNIFQNRYVELETPAPFMEKTILNFLFDYLNPRLPYHQPPSKCLISTQGRTPLRPLLPALHLPLAPRLALHGCLHQVGADLFFYNQTVKQTIIRGLRADSATGKEVCLLLWLLSAYVFIYLF